MGKHFTDAEQDNMHKWKAQPWTPNQIHARLAKDRARRGQPAPDPTTVRRFVNGKTFKRSAAETRGRKNKLSATNIRTMDRVRDEIITKAKGEREVTWEEIIRKSRVPTVDRSTAAKHMKKSLGVKPHRPRAKLIRSEADQAERKRICNRLRKLPLKYWTGSVHLFMDNKRWPVPSSAKGKEYLKKSKVRFVIRKANEGLKPGYTKPDKRKHRTNLGGVNFVAGIVKGKVRIWHYFDGAWNSDKAAEVYTDVVAPALVRAYGKKRRFTVLEDNDPTGYKSGEARQAKADLSIVPIEFPTYSPDLNPCDYALWDEVERRMDQQAAPKNESREAFKARLRRTALAIPPATIYGMLGGMVHRTQSVYENNGGHIPRD
jgi:hypothetical protein